MPKENISQNEAELNALVGKKVIESNSLIDSVTKMDKQPMKLFALAVAEIDTFNLPEDRTVHVKKEMVFDFLKLKGESKYNRLKKIVNNMHKEAVFEMVKLDDVVVDTISPIEKTSFSTNKGNDFIDITFSPSGFPLVADVKGGYTPYFILDLLNLTSKYSISLFRWLSSKYNFYENKVGDSSWTVDNLEKLKNPYISFDELRLRNGIPSTKLNDYSNFLKLVIAKPCKEITEQTRLNVTWKTKKYGGEVVGVTFIIEKKPIAEIPYKEDDPKAVMSEEQKKLRKQEMLMKAMTSHYTFMLTKKEIIGQEDVMDVETMSSLAEEVYPIYDKIKANDGILYGGMEGVEKHLDRIVKFKRDSTHKNIVKYLRKSAEDWLITYPIYEIRE